MNNEEIPFQSGESAEVVVRAGNTVRRSLGENSSRVHQIYKLLEAAEFKFSPRLLGIDDKNREIITYIDGKNITDESLTIEIAVEAIKLLRQFHDILATSPVKENQETVCHRDFAPWNVLQKNGHVVGIIDFDDSYPGKRVTDIAYACWTFLDLGESSKKRKDKEQIQAIKTLVETYGKEYAGGFVEELLSEQNRILEYRKSRIDLAEDLKEKAARIKIYQDILKAKDWVKNHAELINEAISY